MDAPVETALQVPGRQRREAPKVALEPGPQVVPHLHPLQVDQVVHVGPVCLALEPAVPDQRVVRPLQVVDRLRPGQHSAALGEVRVVDVGLINPDVVAKHDSVPVAGHRGEHAVPALEGRLVGDAEQLGRAPDGDAVAHEPDEGGQGGKRLAAVLEDYAREGSEPPAAAAAEILVDGLSEQQELVGGQARHERRRDSLFPYGSVPSARTPTQRDCRQTKILVSARANPLFGWEEHGIRGLPVPESSPVI